MLLLRFPELKDVKIYWTEKYFNICTLLLRFTEFKDISTYVRYCYGLLNLKLCNVRVYEFIQQ